MIRSGVVRAARSAPTETDLLQVELDPLTGCGACSSASSCGVQLLPTTQNPVLLECQVSADSNVSIGDRVQVLLPDPNSGWLRIVGYAYGIPTFGMVFGALAGYGGAIVLQIPQHTELVSLVGFVVGLSGGLIAWTRIEKSVQLRPTSEHKSDMAKIIQER